MTVIAQEVLSITQALQNPFKEVHFMVNTKEISSSTMEEFIFSISKYHGKFNGYIHLLNEKTETVVYLGDDCRLDINDNLKKEADNILGEGSTIYS